jgi:hypothetical protein
LTVTHKKEKEIKKYKKNKREAKNDPSFCRRKGNTNKQTNSRARPHRFYEATRAIYLIDRSFLRCRDALVDCRNWRLSGLPCGTPSLAPR